MFIKHAAFPKHSAASYFTPPSLQERVVAKQCSLFIALLASCPMSWNHPWLHSLGTIVCTKCLCKHLRQSCTTLDIVAQFPYRFALLASLGFSWGFHRQLYFLTSSCELPTASCCPRVQVGTPGRPGDPMYHASSISPWSNGEEFICLFEFHFLCDLDVGFLLGFFLFRNLRFLRIFFCHVLQELCLRTHCLIAILVLQYTVLVGNLVVVLWHELECLFDISEDCCRLPSSQERYIRHAHSSTSMPHRT